MRLKIVAVRDNFSLYEKRLKNLESLIEYPYGNDFFKLDHGIDYFSFFKRLGSVRYNLAIEDDQVVACAAGVLREVFTGREKKRCWYLCDLKVRSDFLGQKIPSLLFRKNLLSNYLKCGRAYAISMNPSIGENRVVRLLYRFSWIPFRHLSTLNFYTLSYEEVSRISSDLVVKFGSDSFLSLSGQKDLIMKSSGKKLLLLHYQSGQFGVSGSKAKEGFNHMFCSPSKSELDLCLQSHGYTPNATASVVSHRMPTDTNWDFILSSDI